MPLVAPCSHLLTSKHSPTRHGHCDRSVGTVFTSAFAFEMGFDIVTQKLWENHNKGVSILADRVRRCFVRRLLSHIGQAIEEIESWNPEGCRVASGDFPFEDIGGVVCC